MARLARVLGGAAPRKRKAPTQEIVTPAEDIGRLAFDLIQAAHPHLKDCSIEYLYTTRSRQSKGKPRYSYVHRLTPQERFLSTGRESSTEGCTDFQITFDRAIWHNSHSATQHAILDSALAHIGYDDERERFVLRSPGEAEFPDVVERNGLWNAPLRAFGEACARQLELFHQRVAAEDAQNSKRSAPPGPGPQSPEEAAAFVTAGQQ